MLITRDMDIEKLRLLLGENITELQALNMRYLLISNDYLNVDTVDVPILVWKMYLDKAIKAS